MGTLTRPERVGIERIGVYPTSLALSMDALCEARGADRAYVRDTYMIDERSVNAPWEDPVTMAVNAAVATLRPADRAEIGLLIVASESAVDQEKSMSTWVHRFLELPGRCRNFEVKHACYGATAGLQMAAGWLASGMAEGKKALVISTDHSMSAIGQPWEYVTGAGAVGVLVSDQPDLLEIEVGRSGIYTNEMSDIMRPTLLIEIGNSETSLIAYFDALHACWEDYASRHGSDFLDEFRWNLYHVPLGGMTWRAHRALLSAATTLTRAEARADFARRVLPSLLHNRRMGGTYGASTFIALLGLIESCPALAAGDRLGIFAFGSGSCAELWAGRIGRDAHAVAASAQVGARLDARLSLTVEEYEYAERTREEGICSRNWRAPTDGLRGWYETAYQGAGRLVLHEIRDWGREYRWS